MGVASPSWRARSASFVEDFFFFEFREFSWNFWNLLELITISIIILSVDYYHYHLVGLSGRYGLASLY